MRPCFLASFFWFLGSVFALAQVSVQKDGNLISAEGARYFSYWVKSDGRWATGDGIWTMGEAQLRVARKINREYYNFFFGAIYLNTKADAIGVSFLHHSIKDAEETARMDCELASPESASGACVVFARILPTGREYPGVDIGSSLSLIASLEVNDAFRDVERGAYFSIAVNDAGGYGFGSSLSQSELARERALEQCAITTDERYVQRFPARLFDWLIKKGMYQCKVLVTIARK